MVKLKLFEMRVIDKALDMGNGYILDFSNNTMAEFFEDEFEIEIYDEKYSFNGTSKAKRLRAFIQSEDAAPVSYVLRALWRYRETLPQYKKEDLSNDSIRTNFFELLNRIEDGAPVSKTDALDRFKLDNSLTELINAIERDNRAGNVAVALDRLHTYCMKKFAHLLEKRNISCNQTEPLHSRVGKYFKSIESERDLSEMSRQIIKNAIGVFGQFNYVRNNRSFAHDNILLSPEEARFIFESVSALLRFIKSFETEHFET